MWRGLVAEAEQALIEMSGPARSEISFGADLRYRGQSYELTVPVPADLLEDGTTNGLLALFHAAHERNFGHCDLTAPVEVVSLRVAAHRPSPPLPTPRTQTRDHLAQPEKTIDIRLSGTWRGAELHRRAALRPGGKLCGPAVITQADCTILVPAGWDAVTDELGNLVMELR